MPLALPYLGAHGPPQTSAGLAGCRSRSRLNAVKHTRSPSLSIPNAAPVGKDVKAYAVKTVRISPGWSEDGADIIGKISISMVPISLENLEAPRAIAICDEIRGLETGQEVNFGTAIEFRRKGDHIRRNPDENGVHHTKTL
ncbi:hypothetical protein K438DRAFT_1754057 [Mycena galopus ATCC 62051]|nr:hypothetical protein K438DRAFT_1754057 [Mycena galopus ATCC 62051]